MGRIGKSLRVAVVLISLMGTSTQELSGQELPRPGLPRPGLPRPGLPRPAIADKPQIPVNGDASVRHLTFATPQIAVAVGDRGSVWRTEDAGQNWAGRALPTEANFTNVFFLDDRFGWIAGEKYEPLTHRSRGVIYRTADGGKSWTPMTTGMLPATRGIRFFSPRQGVAAGESSSFFPNGVTKTKDGGLGWTAAAPGSSPGVVTAEFLGPESVLLGGHQGWVAKLESDTLIPAQTPAIGARTVRDIEMVDRRYGWLVGDGGLILRTSDGGLSWHPLPQLPPVGLMDGLDWYSVATQGNQVWIVGAPGSLVLHSADAGRTWRTLPTGQTLPLYAVDFPTANVGIAAGALGTILTTVDGGETWEVTQQEATRCGLLVFSAGQEDVVWETISRYGAADGWVTVLDTAFRRDVELQDPLTPSHPERLHSALLTAGGSESHRAWQFPLRQAGIDPPPAEIYAAWQQLHPGDPRQRLIDYVVRQIRTWQPTVIAGPVGNVHGPQAMLMGILQEAMDRAAELEEHDAQRDLAHLPPWKVTRLVLTDREAFEAPQQFHTSRLSSRLGESVGAVAAKARLKVEKEYRTSPDQIAIRVLVDHAPTGSAKQDLFSGLSKASNVAMKKQLPSLDANVQQLSNVSTRIRNIERILAHQLDGDTPLNIGQLNQLGGGLPTAAGISVLLQMESVLRQRGELELAQGVLERICTDYPQTPHAEWASVRLIQTLASGEQGWAIRDKIVVPGSSHLEKVQKVQQAGVQQAGVPSDPIGQDIVNAGRSLENGDGKIRLISNVEAEQPKLSLRRQQALEWGDKLLMRRRDLMAEPEIGFPLSAAKRLEGQGEEAAGFYRLLVSRGLDSPWSLPARKELWLHQPRGQKPPQNSLISKMSHQPPVLDGELNDDMWKDAKPIPLRSPYGDDTEWSSTLILAHDADYLYLAARCQNTSADRYPTLNQPRQRTHDLESWDRVRVCVDIDRDYSSFFVLAVDCRGWVVDRLQDGGNWDPKWFVADWRNETEWGFEAAIPWDEIAPLEQRDELLLNVARVAPLTGVQAWTSNASVQPQASGFKAISFANQVRRTGFQPVQQE